MSPVLPPRSTSDRCWPNEVCVLATKAEDLGTATRTSNGESSSNGRVIVMACSSPRRARLTTRDLGLRDARPAQAHCRFRVNTSVNGNHGLNYMHAR
eukprot:425128-Pleurochrysis_carterae.AAC.3